MSDTPEIAHALTSAEWANKTAHVSTVPTDPDDFCRAWVLRDGTLEVNEWTIERRHALAALCLYQQPFGFTAEDVATCSIAAAMIRDEFGPTASEPEASQLRSLAARIAALLPPEGTP